MTEQKQYLVIYFASTPKEIYQLNMWEELLISLSDNYIIEVIFRNPISYYSYNGFITKKLCFKTRTLYQYVSQRNIVACLYVNNTMLNYHMLKFHHFKQIHIGHGESDKDSSKTFHFNAYSDIFSSGEIAKCRLLSIGISSNIHIIGKPTSLKTNKEPLNIFNNQKTTILYAPTWEGGSTENQFSSIENIGYDIIKHYSENDCNFIFKPHPLIGKKSRKAKLALKKCIEKVKKSHNSILFEGNINQAMLASDILITDISSITIDYLKLNKPYVTYVPTHHLNNINKILVIHNSTYSNSFNGIIKGVEYEREKSKNNIEVYKKYVELDDICKIKRK